MSYTIVPLPDYPGTTQIKMTGKSDAGADELKIYGCGFVCLLKTRGGSLTLKDLTKNVCVKLADAGIKVEKNGTPHDTTEDGGVGEGKVKDVLQGIRNSACLCNSQTCTASTAKVKTPRTTNNTNQHNVHQQMFFAPIHQPAPSPFANGQNSSSVSSSPPMQFATGQQRVSSPPQNLSTEQWQQQELQLLQQIQQSAQRERLVAQQQLDLIRQMRGGGRGGNPNPITPPNQPPNLVTFPNGQSSSNSFFDGHSNRDALEGGDDLLGEFS